ncbi:MAG TPA: ABC transporter permease [Candidatus Hydrogenedentes bacterium]|nr:ABC transporter permease [Candidatus Hydrogenedentota bacterium]HPC15612.1 ABC transporter permease [Candidatus Hydrogenedentota bacterium]HRT19432.1 ABC transporter permease [Candidatus Hydrogenedentota bacterium]HRT63834.1 ABC transporter permease [Candidatus Hydrogenedentota bacterium]
MIRFWLAEYKAIAKNQGAFILLVGAVVLYSFFYPVPYHEEILREVPVAVVDNDLSELSRKFIRMLDANENIRVMSRPADMESARREFLERNVYGIVVIPADFERTIRRGRQSKVAAYYDTSTLLFATPLRTGVTFAARTLGAGIQIRRLQAAGAGFEKARNTADPLPFVAIPLYNPSGSYGIYAIPAVFILIIQQTLVLGVGMVGGTRRERMAGMPTRRARLLETVERVVGRTGAYLTIAVFTTLYSLAILRLYYQFPLRCEPWRLAVLLAPYILSSVLLGITLSTFFHNRETSVLAFMFTSLPLVFLVGFAWPPEAIPSWLRMLSFAIPSTSGVTAFLKISQLGAPMASIRFEYMMLWALVALYFLTACVTTSRVPVPVKS